MLPNSNMQWHFTSQYPIDILLMYLLGWCLSTFANSLVLNLRLNIFPEFHWQSIIYYLQVLRSKRKEIDVYFTLTGGPSGLQKTETLMLNLCKKGKTGIP